MELQKSRTNASTSVTPLSDKRYTVANSLVNYYLTMMFSFFPLFLTEQYAHARMDKYWFYLAATGVLIISVGLCMLLNRGKAKQEQTPIVKPITMTDIFFLAFIGAAVISTLLSAYRKDAFLGTAGRNNGLFLLIVYLLMYFFITRNYSYKDYVFIIYLIVSSVVALLTVLNFFYIDPLGLLDGYSAETAADFGSTIGNKNIIATFMCIFLPTAVMLFVVSKNNIVRIVAGIAILFAFPGALCANSSSDLLGMAVILPVMAIFCARSYRYLRRCFLALTILFASANLLLLFARLVEKEDKGFEFMQEFFIYNPLSRIPFLICCFGFLLMLFLPKSCEERYPAKIIQIIFLSLFSIEIIGAIYLFIHFTVFDKTTDLGNFEKLLRFSDRWGTHRGFMWRISFEEFAKFSPLQKLFGAGPDTVYYVLEPHFAELLEYGDSSTDCAHNEFINYLLTQGIVGLSAYLGLMGAVIVRSVKAAKNNPMTLVCISAVICYLAQSVVNLYNPIVTPTMFIFLSLAEAMSRNAARTTE